MRGRAITAGGCVNSYSLQGMLLRIAGCVALGEGCSMRRPCADWPCFVDINSLIEMIAANACGNMAPFVALFPSFLEVDRDGWWMCGWGLVHGV